MNTIIEKIRAEIERRIKNNIEQGLSERADSLDSLLSFLSDLEKSEKPINVWSNTPIKAKVKETGKYIMGFTDGKGHLHIPVDHNSFLQYNIDELEFDTLQEQPVCEELEEEIKSFALNFYQDNGNLPMVADIARHFAQWQKEQMMKEAVETWMLEGSMFEPEFIKRKVIIIKEDKQ